MGGVVSTRQDNNDLIDNLLHADYIKTALVERVFRAVDRADYFTDDERHSAYMDLAWKRGNLHLSAPCVYSEVMEGLQLTPGLSFLNLGSGTGYLSTMTGLILGPYGINHGIEIHDDVIQYANRKLDEFKKNSTALDEYEFCSPIFIQGNCLCLNSDFPQYDRVYCGAACPENYENYMKNLIKVGGILVMHLNDKRRLICSNKEKLLKIKRTSENTWEETILMSVSFVSLIAPTEFEQQRKFKPLDFEPLSLQSICRSAIRTMLRHNIDMEYPVLQKVVRTTPKRPKKKRALRHLIVPIFEESDLENSDHLTDEDELGRRDLGRVHLSNDTIEQQQQQQEGTSNTTGIVPTDSATTQDGEQTADINTILDIVFVLSHCRNDFTKQQTQQTNNDQSEQDGQHQQERAVDQEHEQDQEEDESKKTKREKFDSDLGDELLNERQSSGDSCSMDIVIDSDSDLGDELLNERQSTGDSCSMDIVIDSDSDLGDELLNECQSSGDSCSMDIIIESDSDSSASTNSEPIFPSRRLSFAPHERFKRIAVYSNRKRNLVDSDSEPECQAVDANQIQTQNKPTPYHSPYTAYMRAKIQALPLPPMLKLYLNLYREF